MTLDESDEQFLSLLTELSSVVLGGEVHSVSDEFFAEASNLLKVEPAPNLKGQFGPKGALFSGWETRRHNPDHDWCIIKLGLPGKVLAVDIDTSHFHGNEAPAASLHAVSASTATYLDQHDARWQEILPKTALTPNKRHLFHQTILDSPDDTTHVQLKIYPDGGVARLRVYGEVKPSFPTRDCDVFDLASCSVGGKVVSVSDQHFGKGNNLLLPGRGVDMGDGWETRRSRIKGHSDWAVIKLGSAGHICYAEVDTRHFMGNYPESVELHAINCSDTIPNDASSWALILPKTKLGPHRKHYFQIQPTAHSVQYTHVKLTIYPDGGIKRVRICGTLSVIWHPVSHPGDHEESEAEEIMTKDFEDDKNEISPLVALTNGIALPLTPEAFTEFGTVIQAYSDINAAPRGTVVSAVNQGTAFKFQPNGAVVTSAFPLRVKPAPFPTVSIYRARPHSSLSWGEDFRVNVLERHPFNSQAFFALGAGSGGILSENDLTQTARAYLVVVALSREDDKPDLTTMRAFIASTHQGVLYNAGVWHHPILALDTVTDFACVETQIGDKSSSDCELVCFEDEAPRIQIPAVFSSTGQA